MARVDLPEGIAAIHGRIGNMIFRSRKQADGSYKVFAHRDPYRPEGARRSVKKRS